MGLMSLTGNTEEESGLEVVRLVLLDLGEFSGFGGVFGGFLACF